LLRALRDIALTTRDPEILGSLLARADRVIDGCRERLDHTARETLQTRLAAVRTAVERGE
jgi:hypothetical protein